MNAVIPAPIARLQAELSQAKRSQENLKKLVILIAVVEVVAMAALTLIAPYASVAAQLALWDCFTVNLIIAYPTCLISIGMLLGKSLNIYIIKSKLDLKHCRLLKEMLLREQELTDQIEQCLTDLALKSEETIDLGARAEDAVRTIARRRRRDEPNHLAPRESTPPPPPPKTVEKNALVEEIERLFLELKNLRASRGIPPAELKQKSNEIKIQIDRKYNDLASDDPIKAKKWTLELLNFEIFELIDELKALNLTYPEEGPVTQQIEIVQQCLEIKEKIIAKCGTKACLEHSLLDDCTQKAEALLRTALKQGKEVGVHMGDLLSPLPNPASSKR